MNSHVELTYTPVAKPRRRLTIGDLALLFEAVQALRTFGLDPYHDDFIEKMENAISMVPDDVETRMITLFRAIDELRECELT